MPGRYEDAGVEPPLEEVMTDPIITLLLERDSIDPAELRTWLRSIRERLEGSRAAAAERATAA